MRTLSTALLFCTLVWAADEPLPKAETILDHYVEVTGGKAAYQAQHNMVAHGAFGLPAAGIKGTAEIYSAEPAKTLTIIEIKDLGKIESGGNGDIVWEKSAMQGARVKDGDEKLEAIRDSTFNAPLLWRRLYAKAETTGVETINGQECYRVVLTPAVGAAVTQYFAKSTGYLVASKSKRVTPMGELEAVILLDDYHQDGALISPHKMTTEVANQKILMTIDSTEYNVNIPPGKFDPPADILALANKSASSPAPAPSGTAATGDAGKLTLYMAGKPLATETYSFDRTAGNVVLDGSGKATLGTMKVDIEQFKVSMDSQYHPQTAVAKAKLGSIPMAITTSFADGKAVNQANSGSGPKTKEDAVHADPVVVNVNLPLFPWSVLANRASFQSKDPQNFFVYVLNQAEVPATVTYQGKETVTFAGGKKADLHHLIAKATQPQGGDVTLNFWVDDDHHLIKMTAAPQGVEAYQDGYDRVATAPAPADKP